MKRTFHILGAGLATVAVAAALGFHWGVGSPQAQDFHFKGQGLNFTKSQSLNFT